MKKLGAMLSSDGGKGFILFLGGVPILLLLLLLSVVNQAVRKLGHACGWPSSLRKPLTAEDRKLIVTSLAASHIKARKRERLLVTAGLLRCMQHSPHTPTRCSHSLLLIAFSNSS